MNKLKTLYADINSAKARYSAALTKFEELFGTNRDPIFISAPGRTEIGGNHTDHQRGSVLAAAIDLDIICIVAPKKEKQIHIISEGYPPDTVRLDCLNPQPHEVGTAAGLIRGVAEWFKLNGFKIGGFDAYTNSQVIGGSGLSSSAAFEVAVGNILSRLYNGGRIPPEQIAVMGQYAENTHFGKPSGLMDQMASSVGGFVKINFSEPGNPIIEPVDFDLSASNYSLCIVDTKGSHAGLTDEYAQITVEMNEIAQHYGKCYLSEVDENEIYADIPILREKSGDRAVLRAMHYFAEDARVHKQFNALAKGDITEFLNLVNESGNSSYQLLQNIYTPDTPVNQEIALALAVSKRILAGEGACRVHGGGFAGTIQAFVPNSLIKRYCNEMEKIFGADSCSVLKIRPVGGTQVELQ
jgi:galactokinase